ncbi:hypothetical protein [Algoriphagus yeomjeoni]|uniref:DUF1579 domain-containing protein n=1 Tax=Algoriphagus yeomjeoni TaxID=291403 RepID=A0A327PTF4_9BACT|nr:hypothetical protein [Algoriphagus yeomjeoni]RAI95359.1 hypothetical protein LV83_00610 [Algoriphagus yeomjeoni]
MKKFTLLVLAFYTITNISFAQSGETDKTSQAEMKKLSFLVGEWSGSGWMMGQDRVKHTFNQSENIQFKLDSTAILIEGLGKSEGKIVHNAMAIITFTGKEDQFDFQSFLSSGQKGSFKSELIDGIYYWYPTESVRYIIQINEKGQWSEIGEFNQGDTWYPFLEMTLDKKE